MNAENEDDFQHRLATNVKTNLIKRHAAFTFESVHVRSLKIYEYFMVAIISTIIHNDTLCSKSQNDFCCFRRVIWLLTQCFKLLLYYIYIVLKSNRTSGTASLFMRFPPYFYFRFGRRRESGVTVRPMPSDRRTVCPVLSVCL